MNGAARCTVLPALLAVSLLPALSVAQDLLIRGATVHTSSPRGTIEEGDVLVRNGRIAAVGTGLAAAPGATVIEARGRPLTAGLFGGITAFGVEEVSGEPSTVDNSPMVRAAGESVEPRPEFDVTVAFNPESVPISVNRAEGLTFAVVAPSAVTGGTVLAGQGASRSPWWRRARSRAARCSPARVQWRVSTDASKRFPHRAAPCSSTSARLHRVPPG